MIPIDVIYLDANMPVEVGLFLIIIRVYTWCNWLKSFHQTTSSAGITLKGESTHTLQSLHCTQHPQAFAQTAVTPRGTCTVTLPAMAGQPSPWSVPRRHTWTACPFPSHSGAALGLTGSQAVVLGVLPHYLSMATAATEKPVHLLRKWKEATNVSSHNSPPFPPYLISFLK